MFILKISEHPSNSMRRLWSGDRMTFPCFLFNAKRNLMRFQGFAIIVLISSFASANAEVSWPQFRGVNCQGIAENDKPPVEFGPETNLVWKTGIPLGLSSPCIYGDRIFLTALESNKLVTLAIGGKTGKIMWRRIAPAEKIEAAHPKGSPASSTPATDGRNVYVYFGSFGLLAYDFDGREQWRKPLDVGLVINGTGTSPVLIEDRLIVVCDQQEGKSFVIAVDPRTGKTIWQTPRPDFASAYTTPVLWKCNGREDVVVSGSLRVVGYGLKDGKEHWSARGLEAVSVAPTPVINGDYLYVMSRSFGGMKLPSFSEVLAKGNQDGDDKMSFAEAPPSLRDHGGFLATDRDKNGYVIEEEWNAMLAFIGKGEHGVFALRSPDSGDVTATHTVWKQKRGVAVVASPLVYKDRVYIVQDGGRVTSLDAKTGQPLYEQERLGADGEYYASPIAANGHIYFASTRGTVTVIEPGDTLQVKARNKLDDPIQATPAIADDKLYVRGASYLWAFGTSRAN
jgi:outer membrane protein assembly factor BamB